MSCAHASPAANRLRNRWPDLRASGRTRSVRAEPSSAQERVTAAQQQSIKRLLDRLAHPVGQVEDHHGILGALFAEVRGGDRLAELDQPLARSEERRVGKECRSRWSPY